MFSCTRGLYRGKRYNAWYASDISYSEGPWKFYGLPGLILHVKSEDVSFEWEAINIAHNESDNICSYEGYKNFKEKHNFLTWPEYKVAYIKEVNKHIKYLKSSDSEEENAGVYFFMFKDMEVVYPGLEEGIDY